MITAAQNITATIKDDSPMPDSHDQNFKNLILDYPRQALELFAPEEAAHLDEAVVITTIR